MGVCSCGNEVDGDGRLCARCRALQTLGLDARAERTDIERTYRVLVKVWHPDRFQSDPKLSAEAEEKLKAINAAYAWLDSAPAQKQRPPDTPAPAASASTEPTESGARQPAIRRERDSHGPPLHASSLPARLLALVCALIVLGVGGVGADSYLANSTETARPYNRFKSDLRWGMAVTWNKVRNNINESWKASGGSSKAPGQTEAQSTPAAATMPAPKPAANPQAPVPVHMPSIRMPYVTVGLSRDEVAGVLGMPLVSTEGELQYKGARFFLRNNTVVGWKLDSAAALKHVRLWPEGRVDPAVKTFTMGSPRNIVIAVQGTPTLLTENKLGYGGSEVFLQDGRVVGWNDDHASIRLRVVSH